MNKRKIVVISTQRSTPVIYDTDVQTWGELLPLLQSDYGSMSNITATIKDTKTSLNSQTAILPTSSFTLLLTQDKIKAGATVSEIIEEVVANIKK